MYSHIEILKKIPLFSKLSHNELEDLCRIAHVEEETEGTILIKEGTSGGELYILMRGELSIWKNDEKGHALELSRLANPGDFVGEMSLFDEKPRSATVKVEKPSEILKINRTDLFRKLGSSQNILIKILEEISGRFREFNEKYFHDIIQKNEALQTANEELKKLDTLKSNFISLTSHELKTPLNSILNAGSLLTEFMAAKLNDNEKKCFSIIHTNVMRLNHAYNEIIRVAEIEHPEGSFERKEPTDINEIIDSVADEIEPFTQKRKQKLIISKESCPFISINKEQIRQALLNIAHNAIKFTPDEGTITLGTSREHNCLLLKVYDTGIGIPKEEQKKIFDSFYEIGSINTHKSGTYEFMSKGLGLGLSIAKKFALANGGAIQVESEEGKGSTFIISFKL